MLLTLLYISLALFCVFDVLSTILILRLGDVQNLHQIWLICGSRTDLVRSLFSYFLILLHNYI